MVSTSGKDTSYGALIAVGGVDYADIAGCIAIETNDLTSTGCGAKNQATSDCEQLACETNCPAVTDQTTFQEYTACTTAADGAVCKSYLDAECNFADAGTDSGEAAYNICVNHASFQDYYNAMATVFCGGLPATDAGSSDASLD